MSDRTDGATKTWPIQSSRPASVRALSDDQLEVELTIRGSTPGRRQYERFVKLLHEQIRRRAASAR